jgi:hypothetical protein
MIPALEMERHPGALHTAGGRAARLYVCTQVSQGGRLPGIAPLVRSAYAHSWGTCFSVGPGLVGTTWTTGGPGWTPR